MTRPTIAVANPLSQGVAKHTAQEIMSNEALRHKIELNTANYWAKNYKFNGDLSITGLAESGKSLRVAVNGVEAKANYVVCGGKTPRLISGRAISFAINRKANL